MLNPPGPDTVSTYWPFGLDPALQVDEPEPPALELTLEELPDPVDDPPEEPTEELGDPPFELGDPPFELDCRRDCPSMSG